MHFLCRQPVLFNPTTSNLLATALWAVSYLPTKQPGNEASYNVQAGGCNHGQSTRWEEDLRHHSEERVCPSCALGHQQCSCRESVLQQLLLALTKTLSLYLPNLLHVQYLMVALSFWCHLKLKCCFHVPVSGPVRVVKCSRQYCEVCMECILVLSDLCFIWVLASFSCS